MALHRAPWLHVPLAVHAGLLLLTVVAWSESPRVHQSEPTRCFSRLPLLLASSLHRQVGTSEVLVLPRVSQATW